jgi:hypothetical protein
MSNKRLHAERIYTLSVIMQILSPSGEPQAVRQQSYYNNNEIEGFPMDKFLRSVITIERTFQIFALVGVILLLGYFGLKSFQRDRTPSVPETSPTTQLK